MKQPLAIDLFCGLGGWSEALLAEGWDVVGFDVEQHRYPRRQVNLGEEHTKSMGGKDSHGNTLMNRALEHVYGFHRAPLTGEWDEYPAQLVLQDVLTLNGAFFRDASLIVASPPCQEYSYMAMPWSRAKERARKYRAGELDVKDLTRLFDACFRIQAEAIEAAGQHIPLIVENVRGAQPWVGRAKWNFGSYYLWGDVPALMPITFKGFKSNGMNWSDRTKHGQDFTRIAGQQLNGASHETRGVNGTGSWFGDYQSQKAAVDDGVKQGGDWFGANCQTSMSRRFSSKSRSRKAASAHIAKIPFALAQHIANVFKP